MLSYRTSFLSFYKQINIGTIKAKSKNPVTKNGSLNPPSSNKNDPMIGPDSMPSPVKVCVNPIRFLMLSEYSWHMIDDVAEFKHPLPKPSMNLHANERIPYAVGF